jgi:hypothetical protein
MNERQVLEFERRQRTVTRQRAVNVLWEIIGLIALVGIVWAVLEFGG